MLLGRLPCNTTDAITTDTLSDIESRSTYAQQQLLRHISTFTVSLLTEELHDIEALLYNIFESAMRRAFSIEVCRSVSHPQYYEKPKTHTVPSLATCSPLLFLGRDEAIPFNEKSIMTSLCQVFILVYQSPFPSKYSFRFHSYT